MVRATDETFPVLCLQSRDAVTRAELELIMRIYVRAYARRQRLICVSDARNSQHDAAQRKLWADFTTETLKFEQGLCVANVLVLDSPLLRGALTAINWLVPPAIPQHVVPDTAGAVEVTRTLARVEGIVVRHDVWHKVAYWFDAKSQAESRT